MLSSTPLQLPILSNIAPPTVKRETETPSDYKNAMNSIIPLPDDVANSQPDATKEKLRFYHDTLPKSRDELSGRQKVKNKHFIMDC